MITHNPLHGSGRAALPHPALALGDDARAAQGIGLTDDRQRQPAVNEAPHAIPKDAAVLAAPRQCAMPEPSLSFAKTPQGRKSCACNNVTGLSTCSSFQTHFGFWRGIPEENHTGPKPAPCPKDAASERQPSLQQCSACALSSYVRSVILTD